jgi:hypothetical protein
MKKSLIFIVLVMVLCFCTSSYGADAAGHSWYLGIGGSWAIENLDTDDVEEGIAEYLEAETGLGVDMDDGYGVQAKVGYHLNDTFSLGLVFDYIFGFDSDESVSGSAEVFGSTLTGTLDAEAEIDVWTLMLEGKASMSGTVSPYVVLGVGVMQADQDADLTATLVVDGEVMAAETESFDDDDTGACGKVGLGIDWWATPDLTVGLEGSYVFGFGDLELEDVDVGIDYFTIALGIAFHF